MITYRIVIGERVYEAELEPGAQPESYRVNIGSQSFVVSTKPGLKLSAAGSGGEAAASDAITAKIPGRVVAIHVKNGDKVKAGSKLLTVNSMKMDTVIETPHAGTVADLDLQVGDIISTDKVLMRVKPKK